MATYSEISNLILTNLESGSNISASSHRAVEQAILDFANAQWLPGDVKEVDCTLAYIQANFESNGLGKNERLGWAICNGQNGTKDRRGRVPVGYDSTKTLFASGLANGIGEVGGNENHSLSVTEMPPHQHLMRQGNVQGNQYGIYSYTSGDDATGTVINTATTTPGINSIPRSAITGGANSTSEYNFTGGAAVAHNNMQPYIVTLFIQKI